jgi:hypothetical protein
MMNAELRILNAELGLWNLSKFNSSFAIHNYSFAEGALEGLGYGE